ncbi:MAG TPA: aldo/keto reductase [Acidobacteriota bacterium]|nr:aldo/keto reductase [Acidobacteriota bacterium]
MEYRKLGNSGLNVSVLSVGTVALGMRYGIETPNEKEQPPAPSESTCLLQEAADRGINLFDTAPGYGISETLIGKAIGSRFDALVATKVAIEFVTEEMSARGVRNEMLKSVDRSRHNLQRDQISLLQIHNATRSAVNDPRVIDALHEILRRKWALALGASVYGEDNAMAVIEHPLFSAVQVAFNLLDQRMKDRVFAAARHYNTGILARSAFLKGALTPRACHLPEALAGLTEGAAKACTFFGCSWSSLPSQALRFVLSHDWVDSVLVGIRNAKELAAALETLSAGPFPDAILSQAADLALDSDQLLNPSNWAIS